MADPIPYPSSSSTTFQREPSFSSTSYSHAQEYPARVVESDRFYSSHDFWDPFTSATSGPSFETEVSDPFAEREDPSQETFGPSIRFPDCFFEKGNPFEQPHDEGDESDEEDLEINGFVDETQQRLLEQYELQDNVIPEGSSQTHNPLHNTTTREALQYDRYRPPKLVHVSTPRTTPNYSSPRKFKASSTATTRKGADFKDRILEEMDAKFVQLDVEDFLRNFCGGKNMTARQLKKVGDLADLDTSEESRMYPTLVSICFVCPPESLDRRYLPVRRVQSRTVCGKIHR